MDHGVDDGLADGFVLLCVYRSRDSARQPGHAKPYKLHGWGKVSIGAVESRGRGEEKGGKTEMPTSSVTGLPLLDCSVR